MTTTTNKGYTEPTVGGDVGSWGNETNSNWVIADKNLGGNLAQAITSADVTLSSTDAQNLSYTLSGTLTASRNLIFPATGGIYLINNGTDGTSVGYTVTAITSAGGAVGATLVLGQNIVATDGTTMWLLASPARGGNVNKFRNGTFDVWQRGTGSITVTTAGAYAGADGWIVLPTGASVTAIQTTGRLLTEYSLKVTGAASVTDVIIKQRIESLVAAPLSSQMTTVQAWVFNNTGGSITPTLTVKHATAQDNWAGTSTDVSAVSLQACANAAWTRVAYSFLASASSLNGLEVAFDFGNNFSTNGKFVQLTECDIRVTLGVAVGLNAIPPPPELRHVAGETDFCKRYFYRVTPASNGRLYASILTTSSAQVAFGAFPVTMRGTPMMSDNLSGSSPLIFDLISGTNGGPGANSFNSFGAQGYGYITYTGVAGSPLTVNHDGILLFDGTYYIQASAEL